MSKVKQPAGSGTAEGPDWFVDSPSLCPPHTAGWVIKLCGLFQEGFFHEDWSWQCSLLSTYKGPWIQSLATHTPPGTRVYEALGLIPSITYIHSDIWLRSQFFLNFYLDSTHSQQKKISGQAFIVEIDKLILKFIHTCKRFRAARTVLKQRAESGNEHHQK